MEGVVFKMVITLVTDTFNINNNGTTISATRFAESLSQRGHQIRVITCGDTSSGKDADTGFECFICPSSSPDCKQATAHHIVCKAGSRDLGKSNLGVGYRTLSTSHGRSEVRHRGLPSDRYPCNRRISYTARKHHL